MVDYKFKRKPKGTHCSKGHEFTEENTFTRPYDNARVCRECRKQYAREKYQRNKDKNGGVARLKKDKQPIFEMLESSQISESAMSHWNALQDGLREHQVPCAGTPSAWADNSILYSAEDAESMCHGCPLLKQCYDYAVADNVNAGIWGGCHFDEQELALFEEEDMI